MGKKIPGGEPQIALPLPLPAFAQPAFAREVKSGCPKWVIDDFSIFPSSSLFPFCVLIRSQVSTFACGAANVAAKQVWEEGGYTRGPFPHRLE